MSFIKKLKRTMLRRVDNSLPTVRVYLALPVGNELPTLRGWLKPPQQYGRSIL